MASTAFRVCVVEDNPSQRALLTLWLESDGYQVDAVSSGRELLKSLEGQSFHLLVLDWDLPDIPGDQLLHRVKRSRPTLPVIFQTVHDHEDDIVRMLDAGADDYLVKPLGKPTLLARVRAVLRRLSVKSEASATLVVGSLKLNSVAQTLRTATSTIECGEKEFAIAWYLARRAGKIVLRQQLLADVWERNPDVETRTVDMYVSRLRAKLRNAQVNDWRIQSIYGTGYRLEVAENGTPISD
jgi:two-component system, OmpR family, phosphate regulon response regulator PhoB